MTEEKCCVVTCDLPLDKTYWENQYLSKTTGWDLGEIAPPIKSYIDNLPKKDIAPTLVNNLKNKFENNANITIILGDFFEHQGSYDLIIEQTFFCALPPTMRQKYVWKIHQLLQEDGLLSGLLFNREFEIGPPFGGNSQEYKALFQNAFHIKTFDEANNSMSKRQDTELFVEFQKNKLNQVHLYYFEGITCSGCMNTVSSKFLEIEGVSNVSMSTNFTEILVVANYEVEVQILQNIISYDQKYKIKKV